MSVSGYLKFDLEDIGASTSRSAVVNNSIVDNSVVHPYAYSTPANFAHQCSTVQTAGQYLPYPDQPIAVDSYLSMCSTSTQPLIDPKTTSRPYLHSSKVECFESDFSTSTMTESSHNYDTLDNFLSSEMINPALDCAPSTSHNNPDSSLIEDLKKKGGKAKSEGLVAKRNARERRRVQAVNGAFSKLRKHIPYENRNKRLSKVKTLRIAIEYIHNLEDLLHGFDLEPYNQKNVPPF